VGLDNIAGGQQIGKIAGILRNAEAAGEQAQSGRQRRMQTSFSQLAHGSNQFRENP
jgi:hypothetical protein